MKRRRTFGVADVEVHDLLLSLDVQVHQVSDSFVLLLAKGNVDGHSVQGVNEVEVHAFLKTELKNVVAGVAVAVVLDEQEVEDVGSERCKDCWICVLD